MRNPLQAIVLKLRRSNGHRAPSGQPDSTSDALNPEPNGHAEGRTALSAREYPILAAIWNNDEDAIYDTL